MDIIEILGLPTEFREEIIAAVAQHFRNQSKAMLQRQGIQKPAEIDLSDEALIVEALKQQIIALWKKDVQLKKATAARQEGSDEVDRKVKSVRKTV
jgi:hypothetical protein